MRLFSVFTIVNVVAFGWSATKDMVRESRKKSKEKRSLSDLEKEDDAEQGS